LNRIWIKLSAIIVLLLLVLMAVVFQLFTRRQIRIERQELTEKMHDVARIIASIRTTGNDEFVRYQHWIDDIMFSDAREDLVYIAIFDDERQLLAHALNTDDLAVESNYLTPEERLNIVLQLSEGQISDDSWNDFDQVSVRIRDGGKVEVGFSLIKFNNRAREKLFMNLYILANAFVVVVILSGLIGKRITRPIDMLSSAMIDVSNGNYDSHVEIRSRDELGKLSTSFNYMTLRLREKAAIEDFSRDLVFSFEHSRLVQMVAERVTNYMGAKQGALFMIEERGSATYAVSEWGYPTPITRRIDVRFPDDVYRECVQKTEPFTPADIVHPYHFEALLELLRQQVDFESVDLIAPLAGQGEIVGFLLLAPEVDGSGYDEDEKTFLRTLSQQGALAIRNSLLFQSLTEQERIKKELEIAQSVQKRLLPTKEPDMPGLNVAGLCLPAAEVGGDYYDYFEIDDHRIGIAIADVSGKGASAAFYMAEIKGMMTSMADIIASPKELVAQLNRYMNKTIDKRIFTTMVYGVLDTWEREFVYVRAGHNAVIVKRLKNEEELDVFIPRGMGLGLVGDEVFRETTEEHRIRFDPGEFLVLYTDGISEAMNRHHEEFGEERLYHIVATNHVLNARDMQKKIMRHVNDFVQDAKQHDDITMVIAQFEK
jgi:serine phosphatase RsbU (regulator of sigma subunit)/HAMP domain-containing protein